MYPYLSYCNIVWGNAYSTYLSKLLRLQKRAVRIVENTDFRAPTSCIFKRLQILKCRSIHKYQIGQFIYKFTEKMLPPMFSYLFIVRSSIHNHNTRISNNYSTWKFDIDLTKRSLRHDGIKFWNELIPQEQSVQNRPNLKKNVES